MPKTTIVFKSGYSPYVDCDVFSIGFNIDGDGKILTVLANTPLSDLALCLHELAEWVADKIPAPATPKPPSELGLVDP